MDLLNAASAYGHIDKIEEGIKQYETVALSGIGVVRAQALTTLGTLHTFRYRYLGKKEDLDVSVSYLSEALSIHSSKGDVRAPILASLAYTHYARFERLGKRPDVDIAIRYIQSALRDTSPSSSDVAFFETQLGTSIRKRFEFFGDDEDIETALALHHKALQSEALPPQLRSRINYDLGSSLRYRFERFSQDDDIRMSVDALSLSVKELPDGDPFLPEYLAEQCYSLRCLFERFGDESNLRDAIQGLGDALPLCSVGSPARSRVLHHLGLAFVAEFTRYQRDSALTEAVQMLEEAVGTTYEDDPAYISRRADLGSVLELRFGRYGFVEDINSAVSHQEYALSLCPKSGPDRIILLAILGQTLWNRFLRLHLEDDLHAAISFLRESATLQREDHPSYVITLNNLGAAFVTSYTRYHRPTDIDDAIRTFDKVVTFRTKKLNDPSLPRALNNFAVALRTRFMVLKGDEDLELAIQLTELALKKTAEENKDEWTTYMNNLGSLLMRRFELRTQRREHIDAAISHHLAALQLLELDNPDRAYSLNNLGTCYRERYQMFGEGEDIETSVKYFELAVDMTQEDDHIRTMWLNGLGSSLLQRFTQFWRSEDIDLAIAKQREAVDLVQEDDPMYASYLSDLGLSLRARFQYFDDEEDLKASIECQAESLSLTDPDEHTTRARRMSLLGTAFLTALEHNRDCDEEATIVVLRNAVQLSDEKDPSRLVYLSDLGVALFQFFERGGAVEYIDESIKHLTESVSLCKEDDMFRAAFNSSLARAYRARYKKRDRKEDLDAAITCSGNSCPPNTPWYPVFLHYHATGLLERYGVDGREVDFSDAIDSLRLSTAQESHPLDRFMAALTWADNSFLHSKKCLEDDRQPDLLSALEGYQQAIHLLPQLAWLGTTAATRLGRLRASLKECGSAFGANAAACAFDLSELDGTKSQEYLMKAVELLDQSRTVLWGQISQLRSSDVDVRDIDPELGRELRKLADALDVAGLKEMPVGVYSEQESRARRQMAREFEALVERARAHPELKNFMLPTPFADLRCALDDGIPLVILNVCEDRCDALFVPAIGDLVLIPLPKLSSDDVGAYVHDISEAVAYMEDRKAEVTLKKTLYAIWAKISEPILHSLDRAGLTHSNKPTPIRWSLVGQSAFLPIHGAFPNPKNYKLTPPSMLDRVVSTYIPTLSALKRARTRESPPFSRILVVSESSSLPQAEQEMAVFRGLSAAKEIHFLCDTDATVDSVCNALKHCSWVHFACHGKQDDESPLESSLVLHDGLLSVLRLSASPLSGAELAVLLACETAKGSKDISDEVIHLSAGLHFAGFRRIVGTMWPVSDTDGPILAGKLYQHLLEGWPSVPPDAFRASFALRESVIHLRDTLKVPIKRWLPFVLFGV